MAKNKIIYNGNTLIDLTGDTVTADKLMQGYTAHDRSGAVITGTATGGGTGAISVVDTTDTHGGTIRTITALDISDTTAVAEDVAQGKYFYTADGTKTEGTSTGGGGGGSVTQDQDGFIVLPPDGSGGGGGSGNIAEVTVYTTINGIPTEMDSYELFVATSIVDNTTSASYTLPSNAFTIVLYQEPILMREFHATLEGGYYITNYSVMPVFTGDIGFDEEYNIVISGDGSITFDMVED